ncbi:MAG: HlyC/CorC family transporter [Pedosphaera sp.]|nr:HlyC/CorC family transporter [Pedosphaera sp.]MSU43185.1 HlyC/CorC family transporter [Pedosphaera sp.]
MSPLGPCLLVLFAGAGFFFALSETALLTLGNWRLQMVLVRRPSRGACIRQLLAAPQDLIATIALGNTLAHGALIAVVWIEGVRHAHWSVGLALALLAMALLIFCEVVPKTLAVRRPQFWAPLVAPVMLRLVWLTSPVRSIAQSLNNFGLRLVPQFFKPYTPLTEEEYKELLELACHQGTLGVSEKEIILQIMHLDGRMVGELMRPRSQMACIADDLSQVQMVAAARIHKHHHLPIYDESPDTIVGILNTPKLLAHPGIDLGEVVDFPSFVPENMNLLDLLKNFQRTKQDMAIVLDEFGNTTGMVTLEDILADIIGATRRDAQAGEFVLEKLGRSKWRLSGAVWLEDFRREYPRLIIPSGVDTVGGLLAMCMDEVPPVGSVVKHSGLRFTVLQADERRVKEVLAEGSP